MAEQELRAFWVDAFNERIYDEDEVENLIAHPTRANLNALVVQVLRRAEAFANERVPPRREAPIDSEPYDHSQRSSIESTMWTSM